MPADELRGQIGFYRHLATTRAAENELHRQQREDGDVEAPVVEAQVVVIAEEESEEESSAAGWGTIAVEVVSNPIASETLLLAEEIIEPPKPTGWLARYATPVLRSTWGAALVVGLLVLLLCFDTPGAANQLSPPSGVPAKELAHTAQTAEAALYGGAGLPSSTGSAGDEPLPAVALGGQNSTATARSAGAPRSVSEDDAQWSQVQWEVSRGKGGGQEAHDRYDGRQPTATEGGEGGEGDVPRVGQHRAGGGSYGDEG
jgi:hypothetical protein